MSLHYIYSNASNSTLDITAYCRLYRYSATTDAKEGSVGRSTLVVDDPDGILDFVGHRRLYTYEDLAVASNQVVHNGFIGGIQVSRGPYRNGAGRIWTLALDDTNTLLNRRVMNGADANRPAESDVQRLEALIGRGGNTPMTELNTIDDSLYFSGVDPVQMDAVDYRTQNVGSGYINDCAQASGKNYFVWYRESLGEYSFWYDFAASSNWSSLIRLSNVLSDVSAGSNTFAIDLEQEAVLDRDPTRVASGVMLPYDGVAVGSNTVSGTVYVQDQNTTNTFAAIDWLAPSLNVKTQAKAEARALRYLADAATQDDLIHASVKLPASNVNDILAGMRVEAKFSHLPGYETFTWMRCLSRTVTEISEDPTRAYRLDLELDPIVTPLCLACQNSVIESGNRDAISGWRDSGLTDLRGTTWSYVATNPQHSANALTSPWTPGVDPIDALFTWRLAVGQAGAAPGTCGSSIGSPGALDIMVNLSPLPLSQGSSPPFTALPVQTGTFTVPSALQSSNPYPFFGFTVTADYGAGPTTINEGYSVCLTRIA
jgi:hypothetical protein